jgi:hypothetical protein
VKVTLEPDNLLPGVGDVSAAWPSMATGAQQNNNKIMHMRQHV